MALPKNRTRIAKCLKLLKSVEPSKKTRRHRVKLGDNDPPLGAEIAKKYRKCERCHVVVLGKNFARYIFTKSQLISLCYPYRHVRHCRYCPRCKKQATSNHVCGRAWKWLKYESSPGVWGIIPFIPIENHSENLKVSKLSLRS